MDYKAGQKRAGSFSVQNQDIEFDDSGSDLDDSTSGQEQQKKKKKRLERMRLYLAAIAVRTSSFDSLLRCKCDLLDGSLSVFIVFICFVALLRLTGQVATPTWPYLLLPQI